MNCRFHPCNNLGKSDPYALRQPGDCQLNHLDLLNDVDKLMNSMEMNLDVVGHLCG
jgi:hypothetical protein